MLIGPTEGIICQMNTEIIKTGQLLGDGWSNLFLSQMRDMDGIVIWMAQDHTEN